MWSCGVALAGWEGIERIIRMLVCRSFAGSGSGRLNSAAITDPRAGALKRGSSQSIYDDKEH